MHEVAWVEFERGLNSVLLIPKRCRICVKEWAYVCVISGALSDAVKLGLLGEDRGHFSSLYLRKETRPGSEGGRPSKISHDCYYSTGECALLGFVGPLPQYLSRIKTIVGLFARHAYIGIQ